MQADTRGTDLHKSSVLLVVLVLSQPEQFGQVRLGQVRSGRFGQVKSLLRGGGGGGPSGGPAASLGCGSDVAAGDPTVLTGANPSPGDLDTPLAPTLAAPATAALSPPVATPGPEAVPPAERTRKLREASKGFAVNRGPSLPTPSAPAPLAPGVAPHPWAGPPPHDVVTSSAATGTGALGPIVDRMWWANRTERHISSASTSTKSPTEANKTTMTTVVRATCPADATAVTPL